MKPKGAHTFRVLSGERSEINADAYELEETGEGPALHFVVKVRRVRFVDNGPCSNLSMGTSGARWIRRVYYERVQVATFAPGRWVRVELVT